MEPMKEEQYIHIDKDGDKFYYKDRSMTIRHRLDGAAIEYASGSRAWWVDGKLHRLDNPAVEWANGSNLWYVEGKLHRLNGPAVELAVGSRAWWVEGEELTEEQFNDLAAPTLELTLEDIAVKFGVDVGKVKIVK
jgi:hypothetical protein